MTEDMLMTPEPHEDEVAKWKLEVCKWQDAHSDAETKIERLHAAIDEQDSAHFVAMTISALLGALVTLIFILVMF